MPLDKILHVNQPVLVSCVLYPACVHVFSDCKENIFVCPLGEVKHLFSRGLSEHVPFGKH